MGRPRTLDVALPVSSSAIHRAFSSARHRPGDGGLLLGGAEVCLLLGAEREGPGSTSSNTSSTPRWTAERVRSNQPANDRIFAN